MRQLRYLYLIFKNFFLDRRCSLCKEQRLEFNENAFCAQCVKSGVFFNRFFVGEGNPMEQRLRGKINFEAASSMMKYSSESAARDIIHDFKYHNHKDIGIDLGRNMAQLIIEDPRYCDIDYVVPIPLHPKKLRKRGYNQCQIIAEQVANELKVPLSVDNLFRCRNNESQTLQTAEGREKQAIGLFDLHRPSEFNYKKVLLVDDVMTTGATLVDACRALNKAFDVKIYIFTAAITYKNAD